MQFSLCLLTRTSLADEMCTHTLTLSQLVAITVSALLMKCEILRFTLSRQRLYAHASFGAQQDLNKDTLSAANGCFYLYALSDYRIKMILVSLGILATSRLSSYTPWGTL